MAYVDNNLVVAGGVTAAGVITYQTPGFTGNSFSDNTIDLGVSRDLGAGQNLLLRAYVGAAFVGLTSLEIQAIVADDAGLTTNPRIIASTGAIAVAYLKSGASFVATLNPRIGALFKGRRYLGVQFVVTGTGSAGTIFVDFGLEVQDGQKFYPNGFGIL